MAVGVGDRALAVDEHWHGVHRVQAAHFVAVLGVGARVAQLGGKPLVSEGEADPASVRRSGEW